MRQLSLDEIKVQLALGTMSPNSILERVSDPKILMILSNSNDDNIRFAVAAHLRTPKSVLIKLTKDKNAVVAEEAKGMLFIRSKGTAYND